jgi:type IV pilus assembly protein PilP
VKASFFLHAALATALASQILACGEDAPPPASASAPAGPSKPAARGETKATAAQATTTVASSVTYMYNPVGKRDPFRSIYMESGTSRSESGGSEAALVCTEPLCTYNLNELTLVAVVSGDANPLAMVEDRTGVGHIVRRNTKIGRQGGKVTQILRDCIVVTSFVSGPDGKAQPNKDTMCVRADARSAPVLDLLGGKNFQ